MGLEITSEAAVKFSWLSRKGFSIELLTIDLFGFFSLKKASPKELVKVLYLPSLTEDIEYMTTKNANNKVMKSA